ncbi:MAG: alpha/beta hydrolase [Armatimonadetes bacterium]|nr:alpha/beta hydrolase [Armatimonadota bacterium]
MWVTSDGNRLYVEAMGSGPPIIVLHGGPGVGDHRGNKKGFTPLADAFTLVFYDARGCGVSEGNPPLTHDQLVADVEAIRRHLDLGPVVLAGGSYGGFISLEYALCHPRNVRAIVARSTAARFHHQEKSIQTALARNLPGVDRPTLERFFGGKMRDDDDLRALHAAILPLYNFRYNPEHVPDVKTGKYRVATHNWAFGRNLPGYDLRPRLREIRVPVLVAVGRHDWITPVECSEELARALPNARLEIFEESGHSPHLEENAKFVALVREFLGGLSLS